MDGSFRVAALTLTIFLGICVATGDCIGCFVCSSINGSEPQCEDTFNNTGGFYRANCEAGRQGRSGTFPGTQCIKMKAKLDPEGDVVVRGCVVDNGGINSDTEIGRLTEITHCGMVNWMNYDGNMVQGCILSCATDACNKSSPLYRIYNTLFLLPISSWLLFCHSVLVMI